MLRSVQIHMYYAYIVVQILKMKIGFLCFFFSNKNSLEIGSKMNLKSPAKDLKFTEFIIINFMSITFKQNMQILTISLDACFEVSFFIIRTCLFPFLKVLLKFYRKKFHFDYQFIFFLSYVKIKKRCFFTASHLMSHQTSG